MDFSGHTTLYIPNCGDVRSKWMHSPVSLTQDNAKNLGIDTIATLGDRCAGYQLFPFFKMASYGNIVALLEKVIKEKGTLFTLHPDNEHAYVEQRLVLNRLQTLLPHLASSIVDISPVVGEMRRRKDGFEIDRISKAIDITVLAQEAAAQAIEPGILECEVQASLEYMMTGSASRPAFPSIVATGKNATILHYMQNEGTLKNGELVVVDIGAVYDGYCADLTRTYPVSGQFSKRQRELYQIVLDTQLHVADKAMPGMYLNNAEYPDKSLHHIALAYLKKHGYDHYFIHGIGHFLGLDVHDVGNAKTPLQEQDVFTIEPGIYIPEEGIGIRIEDDFWMAKKGVICLSEHLPKDPHDIETLVQQSLQNDEMPDEDDIQHMSMMMDDLEEIEH
jgi:Xaa-Pro aminopeptidase